MMQHKLVCIHGAVMMFTLIFVFKFQFFHTSISNQIRNWENLVQTSGKYPIYIYLQNLGWLAKKIHDCVGVF